MCTIFTMIIFVTISISFQSFADCVKKICQAVSPCLRMTDKISDLKEKKNSKDFTSRSKSIAQYNQRLWNVMSINNLKCQVYKYFFPDK